MAESRYDHDPTLGVLELASIAKGIDVVDVLLKTAEVRVLVARPVSPGKYVIVVTGSVEAMRSALAAGIERAGHCLLDRLFLPAVHDGVFGALARPVALPELDAIGVIETTTVAAAIEAADAAAKRALVTLLELRLAHGIGGKSYFTLTGEVADVESALAAAMQLAGPARLVMHTLIARPHPELRDVLCGHERPLEG